MGGEGNGDRWSLGKKEKFFRTELDRETERQTEKQRDIKTEKKRGRTGTNVIEVQNFL